MFDIERPRMIPQDKKQIAEHIIVLMHKVTNSTIKKHTAKRSKIFK